VGEIAEFVMKFYLLSCGKCAEQWRFLDLYLLSISAASELQQEVAPRFFFKRVK
jgi:hypothetical protein